MLRRFVERTFCALLFVTLVVGCSSEPPNPCKDVSCQAGETCKNGTCFQDCTTSQTQCGTKCFDTQTDTKNCGQCGNLCREGEVCEKGACKLTCKEGTTLCGTLCMDTQTNTQHCGACDQACKAGEICKSGACKQVCPVGTTDCSGQCKDTQNDPAHCGACGTTCKTGEVCKAGACVSVCPQGQNLCNGQCIDTQTSRLHCGACDTACAAGQRCVAGQCSYTCPQGQTLCKDKCVDLQSSQAHCGACDVACKTNEVCSQGTCGVLCATGLTLCGSSCVDTQTSKAHCGSCSNVCRPVDVCTAGSCSCPQSLSNCSGNCVDLQNDNLNCGTCGTSCPLGQSCLSGKCEAACRPGETNCAGSCSDLVTDTRHCGTCGNSCLTGNNCCNGGCRNPNIDDKNCGKCGTVCAGGRTCQGGSCLCPTGQTLCSNACTNINNDAKNCGNCGKACQSTETCQRGVCKPAFAVSAGGLLQESDERGVEIVADASGNAYIMIQFNAEITAGAGSFSTAGRGLLVAKLDSQMQVQWAVSPGLSDFAGRGIGVDSKGNVYIAGSFSTPTATFGTTTLTNPAIVSSHNSQIFVAKLDSQGKWLWAVQGGGNNQDEATGLAVDSSGNVYLSGFFSTGFTTPTASFGTYRFSSQSRSQDFLVAKLDTNGAWQWAVAAGGANDDEANAIALDSKGNVLLTGLFNGSLTLGSTSLTSQSQHLFVAQLDSKGTWKWAKSATGTITSRLFLTTDTSDNVLVAGSFSTGATFGSTALSASSRNPFVAQLNNQGAWQWAVTGGGNLGDSAGGLGVDSSGNVYLTGTIASSTATFGSTSFATLGGAELFLAQLDKTGKWKWSKSYGGTKNESAASMAVTSTGTSYILGELSSSNALFGSTSLSTSGGSDIFVASFTNTGDVSATTTLGGTSSKDDRGYSIALDSAGNLYVSGFFEGSMTLGTNVLTSVGGRDAFVAKLSNTGSWLWAVAFGSLGTDTAYGVTTDTNNNVYVTGTFGGSGSSNVGTFGTLKLTTKGDTDVFIAKLSSTGSWIWVKAAGGTDNDRGSTVKTDASGNVYVGGFFSSNSNGAVFGTTTFTGSSGQDAFVARLNTQGNWQWTQRLGGQLNDYVYDLTLDKNGYINLVGATMDKPTFGSLSLSTNSGSLDLFVAQLANTGTPRWFVAGGSANQDSGYAIDADSSGNLYIAGVIAPSFGEVVTVGSFTTTGVGGTLLFVSKLSNTGVWQWSKTVGNGGSVANGIRVDNQNNVYVSGVFQRQATFGSLSVSATLDTCHIFAAKLDSAGTWQGVSAAPTPGTSCDYGGEDVVVDSSGSAFVVGFFRGSGLFSNIPLQSKGDTDLFVWKTTP